MYIVARESGIMHRNGSTSCRILPDGRPLDIVTRQIVTSKSQNNHRLDRHVLSVCSIYGIISFSNDETVDF